MKINSGKPTVPPDALSLKPYFLDFLDFLEFFFFVLRFPACRRAFWANAVAKFPTPLYKPRPKPWPTATAPCPTPFPTLPKVVSPEAALFWSTVVLSSSAAGLHVEDASIEATVAVISGSHLYFLSPVFAEYPTQLPVQDGVHSPVLLQQYVLPPPLIFLRPVRARFAVLRAIYKI